VNLHSIVAPCVGAVNPNVGVTILPSTGSVTNPDGSRVPSYGTPVSAVAQVQALTYTDLRQLDGLNITGIRKTMYLYGDVEAIVRVAQQGGTLIQFNNQTWLVVQVPENWNPMDGWVRVIVTLQNGS
jgi:hypothetical protein